MIHSLTTAESEARHCSIWGLAQKMLFRGTHAHNLGCEETLKRGDTVRPMACISFQYFKSFVMEKFGKAA